MSVDATRLQEFCSYGLMLISGTFQVILAFGSLYDLLGWSAFVGVAIMVQRASTGLFIVNSQVSDCFGTAQRVHCQPFQEPSTKTDEIEGQKDEDDVRAVEQHQEVGYISTLNSFHTYDLTALSCMRGIIRS